MQDNADAEGLLLPADSCGFLSAANAILSHGDGELAFLIKSEWWRPDAPPEHRAAGELWNRIARVQAGFPSVPGDGFDDAREDAARALAAALSGALLAGGGDLALRVAALVLVLGWQSQGGAFALYRAAAERLEHEVANRGRNLAEGPRAVTLERDRRALARWDELESAGVKKNQGAKFLAREFGLSSDEWRDRLKAGNLAALRKRCAEQGGGA